jgi:tetratricopeptide (TPR) repeat protein
MSFAKDAISLLIESDQSKEYVSTAIRSTVPTLVQFGLGFAVPFLSPVIIAASSRLILKGVEIAGDKIKVADHKIQQYKEQPGTKGFLAKMTSPALGLLKKVFPAPEKELYEALTDSSKLKQFFAAILENPNKRQEFEENLKKFLTGNYGDFEEFQRNVKEAVGINVDRLAFETYKEFTDIIYNSEILNKIIALSDSSEEDRSKIEDSVKEIHKDFENKYKEIKDEIKRLSDTFYENNGLSRLTPNYFEDYPDREDDLERWKYGFRFQFLSSIKAKREFRREKIVEEIKKRLEEQHRQLIVGGSGTAKSIVLMEIICDYYDKGYEILWNRGGIAIMNGIPIITFIEKLLNDGNKVLVAVDNVHDEKRSAIFFAMDHLSSHRRSKNVKFLLTARLPEYELLVGRQSQRLVQLPEEHRRSIRYFEKSNKNNKKDSILKYKIPPFTEAEVKAFIRKYKGEIISASVREEKLIDEESKKIYKETKGHPIMVKFSVFRDGLLNDVIDRYGTYLIDPTNHLPDPSKIQTALVCCLLDIANLQITDKLLSDMKLMNLAEQLKDALLRYDKDEGIWRTLHPRWDIELLSYLYNIEDDKELEKRKKYFNDAIDSIFSIKNEQIATSVIQMIATYTTYVEGSTGQEVVKAAEQEATDDGGTKIPIVLLDLIVDRMPEYLSNRTEINLYAFIISPAYRRLGKHRKILDICDKALKIEDNNVDVLNIKAFYLIGFKAYGYGYSNEYDYYEEGYYEEAIKCCDKIIHISPNNISGWVNKGWALKMQKKHDEAEKCFEKAVEIDDKYIDTQKGDDNNYRDGNNIWSKQVHAFHLSSKGVAYRFLNKVNEAEKYYDKAIKEEKAIKTNSPSPLASLAGLTWHRKGIFYYYQGKWDEAIRYFDEALKIEPKYIGVLTDKASTYIEKGNYDEAIRYFDEALKIEQNNALALHRKGYVLKMQKKDDEAEKCFEKVKVIDSEYKDTLYNNESRSDRSK